jgi:signal recognition particle subunit SRP19
MRRRDEVALWPVYFDSAKTRSEGRKVPKKLAKPHPTLDMIEKALMSLRMPYRVVPDAAYPRLPWERRGLILVKKVKPKSEILKEVSARL